MSRRRPPRRTSPDGPPTPGPVDRREEDADGVWIVRAVTGAAATKAYRCPGCDHEIRPATPHVVTWLEDAGMDTRRHWHTPCWSARHRRGVR